MDLLVLILDTPAPLLDSLVPLLDFLVPLLDSLVTLLDPPVPLLNVAQRIPQKNSKIKRGGFHVGEGGEANLPPSSEG